MMTKNLDENKFIGKDTENYKIPVRVVMNNMTIAVFTSDDYASNIMNFNLQYSSFILSRRHPSCFIIKESIPKGNPKKAEFCPFGLDKSTLVNHEWNYDFNLFKNQCQTKKEILYLDSEAERLKDGYKQKIVKNKINKFKIYRKI